MAKSEFSCSENIVHEDAVAEAREKMHDGEMLDTVAGFCDLAAGLGMTKSAVSHQLSTLRSARLVKCRREGKSVFYTIDDDHVLKMLEGGLEHVHE